MPGFTEPSGPLQDLGSATVQIEVDRTKAEAPTVQVTATIIESSARARKTQRSYQFNLQPYSPDTSTAE